MLEQKQKMCFYARVTYMVRGLRKQLFLLLYVMLTLWWNVLQGSISVTATKLCRGHVFLIALGSLYATHAFGYFSFVSDQPEIRRQQSIYYTSIWIMLQFSLI